MTSEKLRNIDLLPIESTNWKIDLDDFVDEYDSRHGDLKIW